MTMKTNNELEQFLIKKLSVSENAPPLFLINEARQKLKQRKLNETHEDIFSLVAAFLNFRIRLYPAALFTALMCGTVLYFTLRKEQKQTSPFSTEYVSNIAAVRNSTVLSSINTFILRK
jgi:hypothetical protein